MSAMAIMCMPGQSACEKHNPQPVAAQAAMLIKSDLNARIFTPLSSVPERTSTQGLVQSVLSHCVAMARGSLA